MSSSSAHFKAVSTILIKPVVNEIMKQDDDLKKFIQEIEHHKGRIYLRHLNPVMESYKSFSREVFSDNETEEFKKTADPPLMAFALWQQETQSDYTVYVVSDERRSKTPSQKLNKIKIPEVCDKLDIEYLHVAEFLFRLGSKQL